MLDAMSENSGAERAYFLFLFCLKPPHHAAHGGGDISHARDTSKSLVLGFCEIRLRRRVVLQRVQAAQ